MNEEGDGGKRKISLYEFYVLGTDRLLLKAPWELGRAVSAYHEMFLTEQRCIGLTILLLMGEDHVPTKGLNVPPGYKAHARASTNQAVFMRALKYYFQRTKFDPSRAEKVLARMVPYVVDARKASETKGDPLKQMYQTICKRASPKDEHERKLYAERVCKMYDYIENLVQNDLLVKYRIS